MAYPATFDSFTSPSGTNTVDVVDHGLQHTNHNTAIVSIETVVGTTNGTNVLKNFAAGDFPSRINSSNVPQQISSSGTINNATVGSPAITSGTANGMTLGTPIIDHFTSSGTTLPSTADRGVAPTTITLTDQPSGTIIANAPSGQIFHTIMGTNAVNRTIGTPTNPSEGQIIGYRIKQNAANVGTLVWASIFRFSDYGTPTLGTASTYNYYFWRYNSIDSKWDFQGASKNII